MGLRFSGAQTGPGGNAWTLPGQLCQKCGRAFASNEVGVIQYHPDHPRELPQHAYHEDCLLMQALGLHPPPRPEFLSNGERVWA